MKNVLFLLLLTIGFLSCSKDDDNNNNNNNSTITAANLATTVSAGTWRITYYFDTDHEETTNYAGYSFTFAGNNVVTASKPGATPVTGSWTTGLDDSKVKLILAFATPAGFSEISDDWHVTERTDTRIKLQDVSGGNGGIDYLYLERN